VKSLPIDISLGASTQREPRHLQGEDRFRLAALLSAVCGAVAYALAAGKPHFAILAVLVAGLSAWMHRRLDNGLTATSGLPRWMLNGLVVASIINLVAQLLGPQEVITCLTDFLYLVMLVKMLDRQRVRDEAQLLALGVFVVIGALLTGQSLTLGLSLLVYAPITIAAAVLLQVYGGVSQQGSHQKLLGIAADDQQDQHFSKLRSGKALARIAAISVLLSLVAGVIGFLFTPRQLLQSTAVGLANAAGAGATTGFRDNFRLGSAGLINEDPQPVMDVSILDAQGQVIDDPGRTLYLRGAVLDRYDPRTGEWTYGQEPDDRPRSRQSWGGINTPLTSPAAGDQLAESPKSDGERTAGTENIASGRQLSADARANLLENLNRPLARTASTIPGIVPGRLRENYTIVQRTSRGGRVVLFAPAYPVDIKVDYPVLSAGVRLTSDPRTGIPVAEMNTNRVQYTVASSSDATWIAPPSLPDVSVFAPVIRRLAEDIAQRNQIDLARVQSEPGELRRYIQAVIRVFQNEYAYTLEMIAPPEGQDAIEFFLFDRREGHCEYFAAGLTAILQTLEIPARIVTGYVAGEYNSVTGHYTVRQRDAHAWVEVLMQQGRWETFDPTPPAGLQVNQRREQTLTQYFRQMWETLEFGWLENVVAYDRGIRVDIMAMADRQRQQGRAIRQWFAEIRAWLKQYMPASVLGQALVVAAAVFVIGLMIAGVIRLLRRTRMRGSSWWRRLWPFGRAGTRGKLAPADLRYAEALAALDALELSKPASSTPLAHASKLVSQGHDQTGSTFETLTKLYYATRFGSAAWSPQADAQSQQWIASLRAEASRSAANRPQSP
jgi:transglutaminase-like putative cysteine protease